MRDIGPIMDEESSTLHLHSDSDAFVPIWFERKVGKCAFKTDSILSM